MEPVTDPDSDRPVHSCCRGAHHCPHRSTVSSQSPRRPLHFASTRRCGAGSDACPDRVGSHSCHPGYASGSPGSGTESERWLRRQLCGGGRDTTANTNTALISYLEANQGTTKFLVAVPSSMTADAIILATNKPVMSLGGFSGSDPILTTSQLAALVKNGTVRFFLLNSFNRGGQIPPQILDQIPQQFRNRAQGGPGGFGVVVNRAHSQPG